MTETYRILKYYFITAILTVLMTAGMCGFFIAKTNSEFMLFG